MKNKLVLLCLSATLICINACAMQQEKTIDYAAKARVALVYFAQKFEVDDATCLHPASVRPALEWLQKRNRGLRRIQENFEATQSGYLQVFVSGNRLSKCTQEDIEYANLFATELRWLHLEYVNGQASAWNASNLTAPGWLASVTIAQQFLRTIQTGLASTVPTEVQQVLSMLGLQTDSSLARDQEKNHTTWS